jgi:hypothetical protein
VGYAKLIHKKEEEEKYQKWISVQIIKTMDT